MTERGPYDVTSLTSFVFLSPPVDVQGGDRIGIGRLTPCGSPVGQTPGATAGFVGYSSDVTFTVTVAQGTVISNATLSVQASGNVTVPPSSPDPAGIVPVVGSTPGALGQAFLPDVGSAPQPGPRLRSAVASFTTRRVRPRRRPTLRLFYARSSPARRGRFRTSSRHGADRVSARSTSCPKGARRCRS